MAVVIGSLYSADGVLGVDSVDATDGRSDRPSAGQGCD